MSSLDFAWNHLCFLVHTHKKRTISILKKITEFHTWFGKFGALNVCGTCTKRNSLPSTNIILECFRKYLSLVWWQNVVALFQNDHFYPFRRSFPAACFQHSFNLSHCEILWFKLHATPLSAQVKCIYRRRFRLASLYTDRFKLEMHQRKEKKNRAHSRRYTTKLNRNFDKCNPENCKMAEKKMNSTLKILSENVHRFFIVLFRWKTTTNLFVALGWALDAVKWKSNMQLTQISSTLKHTHITRRMFRCTDRMDR